MKSSTSEMFFGKPQKCSPATQDARISPTMSLDTQTCPYKWSEMLAESGKPLAT